MNEPVHVVLEEARRHGCLVCGSRALELGEGPYVGTLVCRQCNAVHEHERDRERESFIVRGSPYLVVSMGAPPRSTLRVSVEQPAGAELTPYRTDPVDLPARVVVRWRKSGTLLLALFLCGFLLVAFADLIPLLLGLGPLLWIVMALGVAIAVAKLPVTSHRTLVVQGGRAELGVTVTTLLGSLRSRRPLAMSRSQHAISSLRPDQVLLARRRDPESEAVDTYAVYVLDDLGKRLEIETTTARDDARYLFRVLLGFVPPSARPAPRALPEADRRS